ncbi:ABC transporter substrate-binding protein [Streptomyces boluensis]|uniref:Transporter substrate-binding domain-containing protein n=1 Tax=Streptomyces boluensis TaxID=1775135 RepID=A0A964UV65_9ACTN|nr:ABC transporter substrate-binding protein [Streptomyces boluensis]NBE56013.1 transporter substrate-binding domain-containing protein [Streptomyces boluensis]
MDTRLPGARARRTQRAAVAGVALAGLLSLLTACGGTPSAGADRTGPAADGAAPAAQHKDAKLAALLPKKVRDSGELVVAEGDDYPPLVSLASDNKTLVGVEPELMRAIGQVLGVKVKFSTASFDSIIGGVQSRRYDLAIQAMLDKPERRQHVTFVDYFKTSSSMLVQQKDASAVKSLGDLCGRTAAVEKGTAQVEDVEAQAKKCKAAGKPAAKTLVFPDSVGCFQALSTGRANAFVGGTPTVAYQAEQSKGQLSQVGEPYNFLPYGILVNKQDKDLVDAVRQALQKVIDNGAYGKILKRWNVESGAVDRATVNGESATSGGSE